MSELPPPVRLAGWGRHPAVDAPERLGEDLAAVVSGVALTRGLGRSYGDASLPAGGPAAGSRLADRLLAFDPAAGILRAEAGLSLRELERLLWPRGWSVPVLPGTAFLTLGGMVSADVHGKSHHVDGSFGRYVRRLRMRLADGSVLWTSRDEEPELFSAAVGGMGLLGHLLEVELELRRIPSPWILQEMERIGDLDAFLAAFREAASWPMTVGWIDTLAGGRRLGRGLLVRGRWAEPGEAPAGPPRPQRGLAVPFDFPEWVLAPWSMRLFNLGVYHHQRRRVVRGVVHPESYFHPLDAIRHWNCIYGRRGMTQYQCVVPAAAGPEAVREMLALFTRLGGSSFLTVFKDMGEEGEGLLSFPRPGTTINLDLPVRDDTQTVVDRLNEALIAMGGRIYLAKDAFTRRPHFEAMERDRLARFAAARRRYDPERRLGSVLSRRLLD